MWHLQEFAVICFLKKWSWREDHPYLKYLILLIVLFVAFVNC